MTATLSLQVLERQPYVAYSYSYPHKTAYRVLPAPRELSDVWREESLKSLFLYAHIPFCAIRCGFCNLFTMARPGEGLTDRYLAAIRREAAVVRAELDAPRIARIAVGGGTPTYLTVHQLTQLFDVLEREMGADIRSVPASIESSPDTLTPDHARLMVQRGFDRISIGIQTFDENEARAIGRPQSASRAHDALDMLRAAGVERLNIDLIYGGDGQSIRSWLSTVEQALEYLPEELYLYPLYVRPLTGLDHLDRSRNDDRFDAYRAGRERLLEVGYEQVSMRMFRKAGASEPAGPVYCCQADGMIGLGAGARSYTQRLHYSSAYSVRRAAVRDIVADYCGRPTGDFEQVRYGFELDEEERMRRYIVLSLLQVDGVDRHGFTEAFARDPVDAFPEFIELEAKGLLEVSRSRLQLTADGIALSDAIGPLFYSAPVRRLSEAYEWQ